MFSRWMGKCEQCGSWNSLVEQAVATVTASPGSRTRSAAAATPVALAAVDTARQPRIPTGLSEVDQVLGGGIVAGSIMLLSGDPGIGKSTLVLQIAGHLAQSGRHVLYVSGEESAAQIKLRADRLGLGEAPLELLAETDIDVVVATMATGQYHLVIIDSIQTMATAALTGAAGTVGQITAATHTIQGAAKKLGIATLVIGHVTKDGTIAGPKILEHLVDVVLYLEGERYGTFKALRGIKNRFGSTSETGIFEMAETGLVGVANPSAALLAERTPASGSVVLATVEGTRPLLVEVQALVSPTPFGYPKRTAAGFDLNRLNLLVAVLGRRGGLNLSSSDIYVNVVGGLRVAEPAADLAIICAIASALADTPLPDQTAVFGEVGLSGEVRAVPQASRRQAEAKRLGYQYVIGPAYQAPKGVRGVGSVQEAIQQIGATKRPRANHIKK
jgi:DNA repair protein RadA/Sms